MEKKYWHITGGGSRREERFVKGEATFCHELNMIGKWTESEKLKDNGRGGTGVIVTERGLRTGRMGEWRDGDR